MAEFCIPQSGLRRSASYLGLPLAGLLQLLHGLGLLGLPLLDVGQLRLRRGQLLLQLRLGLLLLLQLVLQLAALLLGGSQTGVERQLLPGLLLQQGCAGWRDGAAGLRRTLRHSGACGCDRSRTRETQNTQRNKVQ